MWNPLKWFTKGGDEVAGLRREVADLRAKAADMALVPSWANGAESVANGQEREQQRHFSGWVYASIRPIAQRIAGQPIRLAMRKASPSRRSMKGFKAAPRFVKELSAGLEPVEQHPLLDLLARPNPWMLGSSLMAVTVGMLELTGKAFWWFVEEGESRQIVPLPPAWVSPNHDGDFFTSYTIRVPGAAEPFDVAPEEIARFYYPDPANPVLGACSPLQAVAHAVTADESIKTAQVKAFSNGIYPGLAVVIGRHPDVAGGPGERPHLSAPQKQQLINTVRRMWAGVHNNGEPAILDGLIEDIKEITTAPKEMGFKESSALTKASICQTFGVSPAILGELEDANRAASAASASHFFDFTVNPKIAFLSEALTAFVAPRFGPDLVVWIEEAVAKDPDSERADWQMLIGAGVVKRDELRTAYGLEPLGDAEGGDELITTTPAPIPFGPDGEEAGASRTFRLRPESA